MGEKMGGNNPEMFDKSKLETGGMSRVPVPRQPEQMPQADKSSEEINQQTEKVRKMIEDEGIKPGDLIWITETDADSVLGTFWGLNGESVNFYRGKNRRTECLNVSKIESIKRK
jgi:hypothetical protein